ncbi:MAG: hypothetical protein PWP37_1155, partial [Thermotogota bacterium]|nr:hypothetical protein [Thermotogota bacterium]
YPHVFVIHEKIQALKVYKIMTLQTWLRKIVLEHPEISSRN